jgi:hypothetical protein
MNLRNASAGTIREALCRPAFRWLTAGLAVSMVGDCLYNLALITLVTTTSARRCGRESPSPVRSLHTSLRTAALVHVRRTERLAQLIVKRSTAVRSRSPALIYSSSPRERWACMLGRYLGSRWP